MVADDDNIVENKDNVLFKPNKQTPNLTELSSTIEPEKDYDTNVDPNQMVVNKIRCCMCGVLMVPNGANTCLSCMKAQVDITEGISKAI
jgi:hypothetical protein